MNRRKIALILGFVMCLNLLMVPCFSQQKPEPLLLSALLAQAEARHPEIKALEREVAAYTLRIKPAQTLPDPMLELGIKHMGLSDWQIGEDPGSGIMLTVTQMFPLFHKLRLAGEIARTGLLGKQQTLAAKKLEIRKRVKIAYFDLYYTEQALKTLEKQKELMVSALALSETRYSVGSGIQSDIFKAQLEISRMDEMILPMKEMRHMNQVTLNLLLDLPAQNPLGQPLPLNCETLPVKLVDLQEKFRQDAPQLEEARAMEKERTLMVQMARKEFKPDLTVNLGYEYKGKLPPMLQLMLGVEIPIFSRRKQVPRWQEARAWAEVSQYETHTRTNDLLMALNNYFLQAKSAENLIQLYKTQLIPQARLALESSFAAYPVNKIDFMALLSDISSLFAAELALHKERSRLWSALAGLEAITALQILPKEQ